MFWRFGGYANLSSLDSILDRPDVTLEEVLDENDTIAELKSQNAKLIDFLREEAVLQKLLYLVVNPFSNAPKPVEEEVASPERSSGGGGFLGKAIGKGRSKSRGEESEHDKQEKQKRKYAYVASEILSSDVWSISEALLDSTDLLRPFWEYIKLEVPLDNLQASYFTKVNEALIEKQPARMVSFIRTLDDVIPNIMTHVDCPMIMDLLLKLISLEKDPATQGVVDWIQSQNLIPILLSYITPEQPSATQTAAGDFLKAIITISANASSQDASVIGPNELTRQLVSDQCLKSLVSEMLKGGNPLTVGVGIVIEVIRKNNSDYDSEIQIGPEPRTSDPIYLGNLLRLFSSHIGDFVDLILSPKHTIVTDKGSASVLRKEMRVAWGDKIEPLGFDRFKTCELMAELLHCSNMGLLNEKGSDAEVNRRDADRERMKTEGKLGMAVPIDQQESSTDFGTSVDSSGFHHAEFTPLGGSPDGLKRYEVQTMTEEDGFEKVALSEAMPEPAMEDLDEKQMEEEEDEPTEKASPDAKAENMSEKDELTAEDREAMQRVQALNLNEGNDTTQKQSDRKGLEVNESGEKSTRAGKRRVPLPPLQIHSKESVLSTNSGLSTTEAQSDDDRPAPLAFRRAAQSTPAEQEIERSSDATSTGNNARQDTNKTSAEQLEDDEQFHQDLPGIQLEDDGSPVLGDLLKMKFVEHHVVPTILDFFFRFPWNNFLHNVVYDVVQQVFNGPMDRGYNAHVAIDLFSTGRITERVIEGQERSDKAQKEKGIRLGYMGHLTLIAEEIVKFIERQPQEALSAAILKKITEPSWMRYVEQTLAETRERDNAILGGVRPDMSLGPRQAVLNAVNAQQGGFGNGASATLANAGLGGNGGAMGLDSLDLGNATNSGFSLNNNSLLSGFGSSDEEDDELDEGSGGEGLANELSHESTEDEEPSLTHASEADAPATPAPLAVPPSRARMQLAQRLADKQRHAEENIPPSPQGDSPDRNEPASPTQPSTKSSLASPHKTLSPTSTRRLRFDDEDPGGDSKGGAFGPPGEIETTHGGLNISSSANSSDRAAEGIEELNAEYENSSDGDEEHTTQLSTDPRHNDTTGQSAGAGASRRQTTRESSERTPLDLGDDDEDDGDSNNRHQRESAHASFEDIPLSSSSPSSTAANQLAAHEAGLAAQRELEQGKKAEQEKLLAEWGLADDEEEDDDGEEDDEDDGEPVSIGSRYMSRRGSGR